MPSNIPALTEEKYSKWLYIFGLSFITICSTLIYFEFYYIALLPVVLLLIYSALFASDKLMMFIVAATPLSLNLEKVADIGGVGFYLPTEPLLFGLLLIFIIREFHQGSIGKEIIWHPITLTVIINLVWILLATIRSEMPIVSIKFFVARLWFVIPIYFMGILLFRNFRNIKRFIWFYIIPMVGVIIYTLVRHAMNGFREDPAHWVMSPFFKDHTSYGAVLAMFIPVLIGLVLNKREKISARIILASVLFIFLAGTVFSYTRAAWLSLAGALMIFLIIKFRIKFRTIIFTLGFLSFMLYSAKDQIILELERNQIESSDDLAEHIQSISNISSDNSNLERINRWASALRMFSARPIYGWGPGTYTFQYAPFQHSAERTWVSTNFGNRGNAHSEYLGPLSESGLFGMLSFLAIVIAVIYTSIRLYSRLDDWELKMLVMTLLLGLITYFAHGLLNNYLDTDKASIPFWGFIAIIVSIDLYHSKHRLKDTTAK